MIDLSKLTMDAGMLRSGYRSGDFTPAEVIHEIYRRIRNRGNDHVWIHLIPEKDALAAAQAVNDRLDLPLAGLPFALKDNIDLAGIPTTAACPAFTYIPEKSATAVRLLCEAGAIPIGKTNMDQFATGLVGTRSPFGACSSVFNPEYISGGSSSGSAVAVAAGLVTFALGTDTAGSGRVPAAFNNLIGLKPTRGLVSTAGVVPACRSLDCVSIFALNIADAAAVMEVIAVEDESDPYSRKVPSLRRFSKPFRFGVPVPEQLEFFGDDAARDLYGHAVERLEKSGGRRIEIDLTPFREAAALLYEGPWVAERYAAVGDFVKAHRIETDPTVASIIEKGESITAVAAFRGQYRLEALRKRVGAVWDSIDYLFLPTAPTIYRIDEVLADPVSLNSNLGIYTNFVNLLDLTALAVPMGFRPDGLPLGVTFIAPAFSDCALCVTAKNFIGEPAPRRPAQRDLDNQVTLAVFGAHLSGLPLNDQLLERDAVLLEATETAPNYALFAFEDMDPPKPGLVHVGENKGVSIETELWSLSPADFGSFVAAVPPPLCIGTVQLADGRQVKGFLCEEHATHKATPISAMGGWRSYLASLATTSSYSSS